jgi:mannose-1-phosphate guanylyltransferase
VPWDDLGSWDALARLLPTDEDGNVVHAGAGVGESGTENGASTAVTEVDADADGDTRTDADTDVLFVDSGDNVVVSDGPHVSLAGVDGLAVVAWGDRVLVVPKAEAQRVRDVVSILKTQGRF